MEPTKYIWMNGEFIPWDEAKIHVLTHSLHYGGASFEGLRAYKTEKGTAIFRLKDHTERFFYSSEVLKINIPYSQKEINEAHIELIRKNNLEQGYIRPLSFYGYGKMGLNPKGAPVDIMIACWPWGAYLPHDMINVKISPYIRIHPKSTVTDAKITGHYVNSILSVQSLDENYQESMLLDYEGNIAEGPGENFFMVKDGVIYTPKLGNILNGITRKTIIELAEYLKIRFEEKVITPKEAFTANEAFYTGTAAEITPIKSIDDNIIGNGKIGPITRRIKDGYMDIVQGRNKDFEKYLTYC